MPASTPNLWLGARYGFDKLILACYFDVMPPGRPPTQDLIMDLVLGISRR